MKNGDGVYGLRRALVLSGAESLPDLPAFPLIIKPLHEGSSKGIEPASVVHTPAALQARVAYVLTTYRQPALVETFVPGREFTVALLGNGAEVTVLPLVEICFAALPPGALPLYGYAAKWLWDTPEHPLDIERRGLCLRRRRSHHSAALPDRDL